MFKKSILGLVPVLVLVAFFFMINEKETKPTKIQAELAETESATEEVSPDKNSPDILEGVEFLSVDDFIESAKKDINSNPPEYRDPSKEMWQFHVARYTGDYAKHYAALSTDKQEIENLNNLEEAAGNLFTVGEPFEPKGNQEELVEQLNKALDEF